MRMSRSSAAGVLLPALLLLSWCSPGMLLAGETGRDFRAEMRDLVCRIGEYARKKSPAFLVVPQNGLELLTEDGDPGGEVSAGYVKAIDGVAQESLFYGYPDMDDETPDSMNQTLNRFTAVALDNGLAVLVTDYCRSEELVDRSYTLNRRRGHISFAADSRHLDGIPAYPILPFRHNCRDASDLTEVENFLYLLNMSKYSSRNDFVKAVRDTDYDLLVTDPFFLGSLSYSRREVRALKRKACGGKRFVLAYLSIGEAEDYRPYWKEEWRDSPPPWLDEENPNWPGNFKVRYWMEDWKRILMGGREALLDRIIDAGFDGVYLDIIDAFRYFERKAAKD